MSTSETDEYPIGKCACGKGDVVKTIVTQDNPWSGADIWFRVDCDDCREKWELDRSGQTMTLRSSLVAPKQASDLLIRARQFLDEYIRGLSSQYFTAQSFKTKKAEHAHLIELGIGTGSYRTYLQDRKHSPIQNVCYPGRNPAFVKELIKTYGNDERHLGLLKAIADADAVYKAAASTIVRHQV